jgi:hypothetical protein
MFECIDEQLSTKSHFALRMEIFLATAVLLTLVVHRILHAFHAKTPKQDH